MIKEKNFLYLIVIYVSLVFITFGVLDLIIRSTYDISLENQEVVTQSKGIKISVVDIVNEIEDYSMIELSDEHIERYGDYAIDELEIVIVKYENNLEYKFDVYPQCVYLDPLDDFGYSISHTKINGLSNEYKDPSDIVTVMPGENEYIYYVVHNDPKVHVKTLAIGSGAINLPAGYHLNKIRAEYKVGATFEEVSK